MATRFRWFAWDVIEQPGEHFTISDNEHGQWLTEDRGASCRVWRIVDEDPTRGLMVEHVEG